MSLKDFYILCEECRNPVVGEAWVNDEMHPRVYHLKCHQKYSQNILDMYPMDDYGGS